MVQWTFRLSALVEKGKETLCTFLQLVERVAETVVPGGARVRDVLKGENAQVYDRSAEWLGQLRAEMDKHALGLKLHFIRERQHGLSRAAENEMKALSWRFAKVVLLAGACKHTLGTADERFTQACEALRETSQAAAATRSMDDWSHHDAEKFARAINKAEELLEAISETRGCEKKGRIQLGP